MSTLPAVITSALPDGGWREKIAALVRHFGAEAQVDCPLTHHFAPGVYVREIFMPAGAIVIGKIHRTEHVNIIQRGRVTIFDPSGEIELAGPVTFVSRAGVQKVLHVLEDTVWSTVHVTDERDIERLEELLIEPDRSYELHGPVKQRALETVA